MLRTLLQSRHARWFPVMIAAWASLFALGLVDNARGPIFPDVLAEFSLSNTVGALFYLATSISATIHNLVFMRFLSRKAPGHLLSIYTPLMAVGMGTIALAPNWYGVLFGAAILGAAYGGVGVAQNAAVQATPSRIRNRALGLLHSMYGISSFLAPITVSAFIQMGSSWRPAVLTLATIALLISMFFWLAWSRLSYVHIEETGHRERGRVPVPSTRKMRWLAAAFVGFSVVCETSLSSRLPLLARREWGFSAEDAGFWLSAFFLSMTAGRFFLGTIHLPVATRKMLPLVLLMAVPFLGAALFDPYFGLKIEPAWRLGLLVAYGFPIAMVYPLAMSRLQEIFGTDSQTVTSLAITTQSLFGIVMNFSLGWLADHFGVLVSLQTVTVLALVFSLTILLRIERIQSRQSAVDAGAFPHSAAAESHFR